MVNAISVKYLFLTIAMMLFATSTYAQTLEVRQISGGLIRIQTDTGLDVVILPSKTTKYPAKLQPKQELILGEEFEPKMISWTGELMSRREEKSDDSPTDGVLIESVMIGEKRAGIRIQAEELNILVASLDLVSDQGFIPTQQHEKIDLLILTVGDAKKLDTARTNLWLSGTEIKQIALNSTSTMAVATMDKFYASLRRSRTLPTVVLPMIQVPNKDLKFGDRQVVLLKELE